MLKVRLLGGLALELDGRAVPAPGGRCGSLLAWLALHGGMQPRARVAARLWPDVLDESARRSLRTAVLDLRRDLGPGGQRHLIATREEIGLGPAEEIWVDARAFDEAVGAGRLTDALELARGELVPCWASASTGAAFGCCPLGPGNRSAAAWMRTVRA